MKRALHMTADPLFHARWQSRGRECPEAERAGEEDGFILLAVLFLLLLLVLSLAIAAPKVAMDLQRDKEIETIHRGLQYRRAIQLYYKKFGGYPSNINQLMNTNGQRFLRKHYLDPLTGKDDWRIIHVGEAKVPPMGPFGQPLAASTIPGSTAVNAASTIGSGSGFGSFGSGSGSSSGSPAPGFGSPNSTLGSSSSGSSGFSFGASSSSDSSTSGSGSSSGSSGSSSGSMFGPEPGSTPATTGSSTSAFGTAGSTIGGGPIMGVGLLSTKASIKDYKKQDHYNKWEFCYFPNEDLVSGGSFGGSSLQSTGTSGSTGTSTGFGSSSSSGFGSGFGFGSSSGSGSSSSGFGSSSPSGSSSSPTTLGSSPSPQ